MEFHIAPYNVLLCDGNRVFRKLVKSGYGTQHEQPSVWCATTTTWIDPSELYPLIHVVKDGRYSNAPKHCQ